MAHGRPTKFTPENRKRILDAISKGAPYKICVEMCGVSDSTFYNWLDIGLKDINDQVDSDHSRFLESLREIEFNRITSHLSAIRESDKGHKGCEWELERSFWKYFSSHAQNIEMNDRLEALEKGKNDKEE